MAENIIDSNPLTPDRAGAKAEWGFTLGEGLGNGAAKQYSIKAKESLYDGVAEALGMKNLNSATERKNFSKADGVPLTQAQAIKLGACVKLIAETQKGNKKSRKKILIPSDKVTEVIIKETLVGKEFGDGWKITAIRGEMKISRTI